MLTDIKNTRKTVDINAGYAIFKEARFCIKCGNPISEEVCAVEGHFAVDNIENKI